MIRSSVPVDRLARPAGCFAGIPDAHAVLSGLRNGLALLDAQGRIRFHNARFPALLGSARNDLTDLSMAELAVDAGLPAVLAMPVPGAAALSFAVAGRSLLLGCDPLPDGGCVLLLSDATTAVAAVQRLAAMLEATLVRLPHGVVVFDAAGRVAVVNPAYNAMFAGAAVQPGDRRPDIVHRRAAGGEYGPGDPATLAARRLALDPATARRLTYRRPNGTVLDLHAAPLPDGGRLQVATDITAQAAAEDASRHAAADMQAMLASIRHGIMLWNKDRELVAANPVAEALLQTRPGFLRPGLPLLELVRDADARGNLGVGAEARARAAVLLRQDRRASHFDRRFTRSGQVLEVRSDPVGDGGFVTTYTDVTDAYRAEQELKAAKAAAEAASDAKSRFLAAVSHELRTPLNQVIGFSDALVRLAAAGAPDGTSDGTSDGAPALDRRAVAEHAEAVQAAGRQLLAMIENVLEVSRLEAGRLELGSDRVVVPRLVQSCMRQVSAAAAAGEVALVVDLPPGLPALDADERRVRQALLHLLTNAVKFTEAPGSVRVSAEMAGNGGLRLEVSDSGIGIAPADLGRIGQPFIQVDAGLARRFEGAGLGLYITRAIMAAHGGSLAITSTVGAGTTAGLVFPPERVAPLSPPTRAGGPLP